MKIGARVTVYNLVMRERRNELGLTQKGLGELVGAAQATVGQIELLRNPAMETNKLRVVMEGISSILELDYDAVFPPDYTAMLMARRLPERSSFEWRGEISLDSLGAGGPEIAGLIEMPDLDAIVLKNEREVALDKALEMLPAREAYIVRTLNGLGGVEPQNCEKIAVTMGVTRSRIRQINETALSRLRHPGIRRPLRDLL